MKTQKDYKTILVEYCASLSDQDLRYLGSRLTERYIDDLPQSLEILSQKPQIDHILGSARSATELYQLCDVIGDLMYREAKKRKISLVNAPDSKRKTK